LVEVKARRYGDLEMRCSRVDREV